MTNRRLLGAVVVLSLLCTLLCVGILFEQRSHAVEVHKLKRELHQLDRDLFQLRIDVADP